MCVCGEEGVGGGVYNCALGVYKLAGFFFFCVLKILFMFPNKIHLPVELCHVLLPALFFAVLLSFWTM